MMEKKKLLEEYSGVLTAGVVEEMYAIATEGAHDFLFINIAGSEGVQFYLV